MHIWSVTCWCHGDVFWMTSLYSWLHCLGYGINPLGHVGTSRDNRCFDCPRAVAMYTDDQFQCYYGGGGKGRRGFFFSLHSLLTFDPYVLLPGRPIPPTSSSSLLPSAQLPSSHNPPPVSCQMPLLDSNTSHQIMDTNPDEEFSPNSYLLRACSGPQQASSSGKEIELTFRVWLWHVLCHDCTSASRKMMILK